MIVLDASAIVEWLLNSKAGMEIDKRIVASRTLHAPHLVDIEVTHALRQLVASHTISDSRGQGALQDLGALALSRYPHDIFLSRVWNLRHALTAYDAVYIALAERLGATVVTCDGKMASAPGHSAQIDFIPKN